MRNLPSVRPTWPLVLATAVLALACSSGTSTPGRPSTSPTSHSSASSTAPVGSDPIATVATTTSTAIATTAPPAGPPFPVGRIQQELVDTARSRTLRTIVHFPIVGGAPAAGPFPLVLMAHGYRLPADGYERVLSAIAAAGYVVAAPDFPHTSGSIGDGNRSDIVNQPADLSFLIDALPGLGASLPPLADRDRVAVLGHSDGGLTATAIGYNASYRDPRVAAVVSMTGGIALYPGASFVAGPGPAFPPLLAVHARADETNGFGASASLLARLPADVRGFLVSIDGGSHLGPYMFDTAMPEVAEAIVAFLDLTLQADAAALERLRSVAARPGLALTEH